MTGRKCRLPPVLTRRCLLYTSASKFIAAAVATTWNKLSILIHLDARGKTGRGTAESATAENEVSAAAGDAGPARPAAVPFLLCRTVSRQRPTDRSKADFDRSAPSWERRLSDIIHRRNVQRIVATTKVSMINGENGEIILAQTSQLLARWPGTQSRVL